MRTSQEEDGEEWEGREREDLSKDGCKITERKAREEIAARGF